MTAPPPSSTPVLSVIMPAYNGAALIGETLDNLRVQTMPDFEVLVVDDCSTDDTRALLANWPDPRVRLIALDVNGGPVRARNRGAAEARGRYIAGIDQDDLSRPERFARQIAFLEADPATVLVATAAEQLIEGAIRPMNYPVTTTPTLIAWLTWIENPLVWSSVMIRADAARRLDPFTRPDILYAEDFDLYHRLQRLGRIARLDTPLTIYRQHAGGVSKRFADTMAASATRVLAETHDTRLGHQAEAAAAALVAHNMAKSPVRDLATLKLIGSTLVELETAFLAERRPDRYDRMLIAAETEKRWTAIRRTALRTGNLGLDAITASSQPTLEPSGTNSLLWSGLIGTARRAQRTIAAKRA
jgi:GT2 family glycosyltransferase